MKTLMATVCVLAIVMGQPPSFEDSCNCTQGDPWKCGYDRYSHCIDTRDPGGCATDCCDECYDECELACVERSITCDWDATELGNCISGCQRGYSCAGCNGPPPPSCP